ncbi:MAG: histidine phosphatase family protein [Candidatus Saccharimonadales bacterium]
MNRPNQLVLVRHAQSLRNEIKGGNKYFDDDEHRAPVRGIADHDIPLTKLGVEQARQTGKALRDRFGGFDYVYHSGYRRTQDTARYILEAWPPEERDRINVRHNAFIRERDPGFAYDMTTQEAEEAFPWLDEYWQTFGGYMARPPGGESLADVSNRVYTFIGSLFRDRVNQRVMVVTHGGTLRCFRSLLERWDYEQATTWNSEPHPENCGVTTYQYDQEVGRLALIAYNEVFWQPNET